MEKELKDAILEYIGELEEFAIENGVFPFLVGLIGNDSPIIEGEEFIGFEGEKKVKILASSTLDEHPELVRNVCELLINAYGEENEEKIYDDILTNNTESEAGMGFLQD